MNLRELQNFLSIAEAGSLLRAARRLDVSQPSLSRDLKLLEQDLGVRLFERDGRGVSLTAEGQAFHDAILEHVIGIERAREEIIAKRAGYEGTIRLGWTGAISIPLGAQVIAQFTRRLPDVALHARMGNSSQISEWVASGAIDLGVMNAERPSSGRFVETFARAPLNLVTMFDPETTEITISLEDALRVPMFVHSQQNAMGRIIRANARDLGVKLQIAAEVDDITAVRPIIARGEGAAIVPRGMLEGSANMRFLVRRIVEPDLWLYFQLAISKVGHDRPAVHQLADTIRETVRENDGLL